MNPPKIIICQCEQAKVLPAEALELITRKLTDAGVAFETVPDLCELAARRDPRLVEWAAKSVTIAACYPRAVQWLLASAGAPLGAEAELINLREANAENILTGTAPSALQTFPLASDSAPPPSGWPAWFPVIDYNRCTQCMQCLGFCLFGVYGVDAEKNIQVKNPSQCKINCPACSRVCPQGAILFPKHKTGAINGQETTPSTLAPLKLDISALLGGDAHAMLRDRSARAKKRFSKERTEDQGLSERRRFLAQQGLMAEDIPQEVLTSLPSAEVVAQKIEEAAARAKAALEAREHL